MTDMTKPYDGGPAFPQHDLSGYGMGPAECNNGGMTLRDWFAGQALASLAGTTWPDGSGFLHTNGPKAAARWAFAFADAMLEVRGK